MSPTLLADLAVMMSSSAEDVGTKALELVLSRSPAGQEALARLLDTWRGRPGREVVRWASQVVGTDGSRTDLEGFSDLGESLVIFENKFWAGLTENQPGAYLRRLSSGDGVLVFMVPASRVRLMQLELLRRLEEETPTGPAFSPSTGGASAILPLESGRTMVVTSWPLVLGAISANLEAAEEYSNLADLRQLEGLVKRMDQEAFRPISAADITGDTPRLIIHLSELVDATIQEVLSRPHANKKGLRATAGMGWYGHYFNLHGFVCQLAVTAWHWRRAGTSPIWMRVSTGKGRVPREVRAALAAVLPEPGLLHEDRRRPNRFWFPIYLLEGEDRQAVVRDMVAQVDHIAEALEPMAKVGDPDVELDPEEDPFEVGGDGGEVEGMGDSDVGAGMDEGGEV